MKLNKDQFTQSTLLEFLNQTYKTKKLGTSFTKGDVSQYVTRKSLPKFVGGHPIEIDDSLGVQILVIKGLRKDELETAE